MSFLIVLSKYVLLIIYRHKKLAIKMENKVTTISREELEELKEAFSKIGKFAEVSKI